MSNFAEKDYRLEAVGFRTGTVAEFLGLTPEESALIETRLELMFAFREWRKRSGLTQAEVAEKIGSSQPRIAHLERGDAKASIDLLFRALFACGAGPADVAAVVAKAATTAPAPMTK